MSGFRVSTASIIFYPSYMFDHNLRVLIVCLKIGYLQESKVDFIFWFLHEPGEKVWKISGMTMPLSSPRDRALWQFVDQRINVDYIGCGFTNGISMVYLWLYLQFLISMVYQYSLCWEDVASWAFPCPFDAATRCVVPGVLRRCAVATARDRSRPIITGWWFGTCFSIYWE